MAEKDKPADGKAGDTPTGPQVLRLKRETQDPIVAQVEKDGLFGHKLPDVSKEEIIKGKAPDTAPQTTISSDKIAEAALNVLRQLPYVKAHEITFDSYVPLVKQAVNALSIVKKHGNGSYAVALFDSDYYPFFQTGMATVSSGVGSWQNTLHEARKSAIAEIMAREPVEFTTALSSNLDVYFGKSESRNFIYAVLAKGIHILASPNINNQNFEVLFAKLVKCMPDDCATTNYMALIDWARDNIPDTFLRNLKTQLPLIVNDLSAISTLAFLLNTSEKVDALRESREFAGFAKEFADQSTNNAMTDTNARQHYLNILLLLAGVEKIG